MLREDLIEGAVAFLSDPSVASAPIDQRIAFLHSKGLSQDEIDASLARAGQSTNTQPAPYAYRNAPNPYQQPPYWAPPAVARRDWRDYFIMATVLGGLGYGFYWTTKRYVYPMIAPPTPPQLEQDKASIDASFEKAFVLLDQLATDTTELKNAEKSRTERLDAALAEVEGVITKMKDANEQRELEMKRAAREMLDIREQIPHAIEKERETTDAKLQELITEMKSLKTLVSNRMSGPSPAPSSRSAAPPTTNGSATEGNGVPESEKSILPERNGAANPFANRVLAGGKSPAIPAWQLAAKKRSEEATKDGVNGSIDGSSAQETSV